MKIDVIILSNMANIEYYKLLEECINSIKNNDINTNIIVVETNNKLKNKDIPLVGVDFIFPDEPFNYNKYINIGLARTKESIVLISNNDIIYNKSCIDTLCDSLNQYDSVSPLDKNNERHNTITETIEGDNVGMHVTGYSICLKRKVLDAIGQFDERFKFWFQDNDYCELLRKHNFKHALIHNAVCFHYGEKSHRLLSPDVRYEYTMGLESILNEKWKAL